MGQIRTTVFVVVLLALAGLLSLQTYQLADERRAHAGTKATHAEQLAALERSSREAEQSARTEEQRRTAEVQKVADDASWALDRARADAVAAADAGQRLRAQLATLTSSCRVAAGHPGSAGAGAPAEATGDMLADVQRRLGEATETIARHADEARAAGTACERSYRALTADPAALDR
jgi:hypothetical protein